MKQHKLYNHAWNVFESDLSDSLTILVFTKQGNQSATFGWGGWLWISVKHQLQSVLSRFRHLAFHNVFITSEKMFLICIFVDYSFIAWIITF